MADELRVGVQDRLASHSAYFNSLIELIPVKHYLSVHEEGIANKFYKNRGKKAPKQAIKQASRRAKRARLDPNQQKTVQEMQALADSHTENSNSEGQGGRKVEGDGFSVEKVESKSLDDLRSRLQAKIQDFQRKRKADTKHQPQQRPPKKSKGKMKDSNRNRQNAPNKDSRNSPKQNESSTSKEVLNDKGEVVFSKFGFLKRSKEPRPGTKVKNYSKLLLKAKARKKKLEALKAENMEKAREVEEKLSWKHAMEKAEGVKQTDDPKLLKKAIKKREKQKSKSKKQWKERTDHQKVQADERQKLRQKHIKERIEAKKEKKKGKMKKKHRPGF